MEIKVPTPVEIKAELEKPAAPESPPAVVPASPAASVAAAAPDLVDAGPKPAQRKYDAHEDPNKRHFEFKVETAETIFKEKDWSEPPVNQRFIFHNKMPKCGSTVFQKLLHKLSDVNKFTFMDVYEPGTRDQVEYLHLEDVVRLSKT